MQNFVVFLKLNCRNTSMKVLRIMAAEHKISKETCYRKLKEQYDGYR